MKKLLFVYILLICNYFSFAQCNPVSNSSPINRGVLAGLIFEKLYENNTNVYDYEASSFPNPFIDLQENNELNIKLKILSYLQYDNALTVYNYKNETSACFKPYSTITKIEALIYIMEAWNIHPDFSGSFSPYNDVSSNDGAIYGYVKGAYNTGIISGRGNFNPFSSISIGESSEFICSVYNNPSLHPVNADLTDITNYFIPGLYSPENLSHSRGLNQGVFNHYAKDSFIIPDRKMSLNFSHFYSSSMVELPEGLFPIKPLGRGWSHTYNTYITRESNVGQDEIDYYYITWQDGTIHIYNENSEEYVSNGVYDDLDELSSGDIIRITHKDQSRHYFEQLDSDRDIWYLTEIRDANGNKIEIDYESAEEKDTRRIKSVEAPSGKKLQFDYIRNTDYIDDITDPIGRKIKFDLDEDDDNRLEEFTDAKGNDTRYKYVENDANAPLQDQVKRFLLDEIRLPKGNKITAVYDNNNAKLESYKVNGDDPIKVDVKFEYASNDVTAKVQTPISGSSSPFTENYAFNTNGLVTDYSSDTNNVQIDYPTSGVNVLLPTETTTNGVNIEYDFDERGNVKKIDKENGDIIERFKYDNDNNLIEYIDGEGNKTEFIYDGNENLIEIKDAYNNSTYFTYDSFGQLLSKTNQEDITINYTYENDGAVSAISAPVGISSSFSYDGINRLLQRDDNGLISSYLYDNNDNLTRATNSGSYTTTYNYDTNDNLTSITNANNIATTFIHDNEDRVIQETFGSLVTKYDFGDEGYLEKITKPSGAKINYDYDNDGRLKETGTITDIDYNNRNLVKSITNAAGTIDLDYDNLNLLEKATTVHNLRVEYDYTDTNQVDEIKYPTLNGIELETNYQYDNKNRIWIISLNRNVGSGNNRIAEYEYHDDDRIKSIELGNKMRINYYYDAAGRFRFIRHENLDSDSVLYSNINTLNERGNIVATNDYFTPIPPSYNPGGTGSDVINNTYDYDNNSHIISGNGDSYNVNNDGNTVNIANNAALTYDIDDRLTTYSDVDNTITFKYNPYNQRVEKTVDGTITKYVRDVRLDNILVELDNNNTSLNYYIYSPSGMLLARMKPNGDLNYYHGDIRGSVVMMTDDNTEITHQYRYDDFGSVTRAYEPDNDTNFFRYVGIYGVEYDTDDLYYMRARYYKPSIGRFLTEDPIWSTNLYPYADNNPISRIDPNGEYWESALDAAFTVNSYYEWEKDPSLLNSAALAFDAISLALPVAAGLGTGIKQGAKVVVKSTSRTKKVLSTRSKIKRLRKWAKKNGFQKKPKTNTSPEIWGVYDEFGNFSWRLKIKPKGAARNNLHSNSQVPRFDARLNEGNYINPLTGDAVSKSLGTHQKL